MNELNIHIKNSDDEIDNSMKPEEKQASHAIQDITGIGNTSAQAIISVIGTDMSRFPTDRHIPSWAGLGSGDNESAYVAVAHSILIAIYHILKEGIHSKILELIITTNSTRNTKLIRT